jgi:hypothetical protein
MPQPTNRELFLQNRLAIAAGLLFQVTKHLSPSHPGQTLLRAECEAFFSETRSLLREELRRDGEEGKKSTSSAAPTVESSGADLSWVPANGLPLSGRADPTEVPIDPEEVSSTSSPGSTEITASPPTSNSETPPAISFAMRLKFVLESRRQL